MLLQKKKARVIAISAAAILAFTTVALAVCVFYNKGRLGSALKRLDVADESTVIAVMKYGGRDLNTVLAVADAYEEYGDYSNAAKLLLYAVQYVAPDSSEAVSRLTDCYARLGADKAFISGLKNGSFSLLEFEVTTAYEGVSYGFSDGVYTVFFGGYAKAKISPIIPLSLSACRSGVYVLDSADRRLKLLSEDGLVLKTVSDTRMNEFLYFENSLYFIDENGAPHGKKQHRLNDGEFAASLCEDGNEVVCTVYDSSYKELYRLRLN